MLNPTDEFIDNREYLGHGVIYWAVILNFTDRVSAPLSTIQRSVCSAVFLAVMTRRRIGTFY